MELSVNMDPNVVNEMYRGAQAQAQFFINSSTVLAAVASAAVLLRLLARWRTNASYGADDLLISLSLIPLWCSVIAGAFSACQPVRVPSVGCID